MQRHQQLPRWRHLTDNSGSKLPGLPQLQSVGGIVKHVPKALQKGAWALGTIQWPKLTGASPHAYQSEG
jgi:hypothetical protein